MKKIALAILSVSMLAGVAPAESKTNNQLARVVLAQRTQAENPQSGICLRAQALDPSGNYRNLPCWARAAMGGSSSGR